MIIEIRNELKAQAIKQRAAKAARKSGPPDNPLPTYRPMAGWEVQRDSQYISALLDMYHEARNTQFYQNGGSHFRKDADSWYAKRYAEIKQELREKFNLTGATKPQEGI